MYQPQSAIPTALQALLVLKQQASPTAPGPYDQPIRSIAAQTVQQMMQPPQTQMGPQMPQGTLPGAAQNAGLGNAIEMQQQQAAQKALMDQMLAQQQQQHPMMAAEGGLASLPASNMDSFAEGGVVGFTAGGVADDESLTSRYGTAPEAIGAGASAIGLYKYLQNIAQMSGSSVGEIIKTLGKDGIKALGSNFVQGVKNVGAAAGTAPAAGILAGGIPATQFATDVMRGNPQLREAYSDNTMLGAMDPEGALGAAILSQPSKDAALKQDSTATKTTDQPATYSSGNPALDVMVQSLQQTDDPQQKALIASAIQRITGQSVPSSSEGKTKSQQSAAVSSKTSGPAAQAFSVDNLIANAKQIRDALAPAVDTSKSEAALEDAVQARKNRPDLLPITLKNLQDALDAEKQAYADRVKQRDSERFLEYLGGAASSPRLGSGTSALLAYNEKARTEDAAMRAYNVKAQEQMINAQKLAAAEKIGDADAIAALRQNDDKLKAEMMKARAEIGGKGIESLISQGIHAANNATQLQIARIQAAVHGMATQQQKQMYETELAARGRDGEDVNDPRVQMKAWGTVLNLEKGAGKQTQEEANLIRWAGLRKGDRAYELLSTQYAIENDPVKRAELAARMQQRDKELGIPANLQQNTSGGNRVIDFSSIGTK